MEIEVPFEGRLVNDKANHQSKGLEPLSSSLASWDGKRRDPETRLEQGRLFETSNKTPLNEASSH